MSAFLYRILVSGLTLMFAEGIHGQNLPDRPGNWKARAITYGDTVSNLVKRDDAEELRKLIDMGMSPDSYVDDSSIELTISLLELACRFEKEKIIRLLAEKKANLKPLSYSGQFPIEILLEAKRKDLAALLARQVEPKTDDQLFEHIFFLVQEKSVLHVHPDLAKRPQFITVNGKPPGPNIRMLVNATGGHLIDELTEYGASNVRIKRYSIGFPEVGKRDRIVCRVKLGPTDRPTGESEYTYSLQFGYWLLTSTKGTDH